LRKVYRCVVGFGRGTIKAARAAGPQTYDRQEPRSANAASISIKNNVCSAALRPQLRAHAIRFDNPFATWACRACLTDCAARHISLGCRREHFKVQARWAIIRMFNHVSQGAAAAALAGKPERADQRDFRPAVRCFTLYTPRPQICDGTRTISVRRVKMNELVFSLRSDRCPRVAKFEDEPWWAAWHILQHGLQDQARDRIEVACLRIASQPKRFEWNRSATGERIDDHGCIAVRGTN
jgi:hypothetical protein